MAFRTVHNAFGLSPVMRHIPVGVDFISVFSGEGYGRCRKFVERPMTLEANIFAAGFVCGSVRL
jgi:hypothetical protein